MRSFALVPAGPAAMWVLVPALVTLALVAVPLAWLAVSARHGGSVDVSSDGIRLNVPVYGRRIPAGSLETSHARVVDLATARELRPRLRTNGVGLPGYRAGWFQLQDGENALVSVTSQWNVLYLPTSDGYVLLLSAADPGGLLAAIRQIPGS